MTKRNNTYEYDRNNDKRGEFGGISFSGRRQNVVLIVASIIYLAAMFMSFMYQPVMDAGPIPMSLFIYGVIYLLSILNNIAENISVSALIALLMLACIVMTISFVISSIKNHRKYADGDTSLFGRNVFYLVTIPAIYLLLLGYFGNAYDVFMYGIAGLGSFLVVVGGVVLIILFLLFGIDKSRVKLSSIISVILSIACFAMIFISFVSPIFNATVEGEYGDTLSFEVDVQSFERFHDVDYVEDHLRDIEKQGIEKVFTDADFGLQRFMRRDERLVKILMLSLPLYLPAVMIISLMTMILSSSAVVSALFTRACLPNYQKRGIIVAKSILAISTAVFTWTVIRTVSAVADVKAWVATMPNLADAAFNTVTLAAAAFPIIAIISAILLIVFNIKAKKSLRADG